MQAVTMKVFGRVQGVGFRYSAKSVADNYKILGFVRNEPDGSVFIQAQGQEQDLKKFIDRIKNSPSPAARIEHVELKESSLQSYREFKVAY
ncbi:acylphosphatase [Liquorilactobacillus oeni]|uniref:Acylphosphatase n=1 Tax=Liquorilactobacillus oeni DSM 19972 TaxID=1423777 RepID=A0A0R1MFX3_9LACO|nr:acylphosphatase [Liquorilactobacillus oeni]KRL04229.1 hypothetical protein FD46_GL001349 [Liquorilactobacillus oeni DSM 19972]